MNPSLLKQIQETVDSEHHGDFTSFIKEVERELISINLPQSDSRFNFSEADLLIKLTDVSKTYVLKNETINALKSSDLEIYKGEIVSVVGPSGSGKSTLLQLIGGLDKPTSGSVVVGGRDISQLKDKELSRFRNQTVGFVFQLFYLQSYLDVLHNVMLPLIIKGEDRETAIPKAEALVKAVGLESRIHHLPKQLSGGQMQRVAIARALANNPSLLLADEPTANLDAATSTEILNLLHKIREDFHTTIVVVTHDMKVANKSDRVIKLLDGQIL